MSKVWDKQRLARIAGIQLNESADDDEDPDAKIASEDKRQREFESRNKRELADADKAAKDKAKEKESKEKVEKPAAKEDKPKAEGGEKGSRGGKVKAAIEWLKAHPGAKRGEFIKWAGEEVSITPAYASVLHAKYRARGGDSSIQNECYVLQHPSIPNMLLAERADVGGVLVWVDKTSPIQPLILSSSKAVDKYVKYMSEWKSQTVVPGKVNLSHIDKTSK